MRAIILALCFLAVLGLSAISMMMNFRFGYLLGANPTDGYIYGFASVCADIMKSLIPFLVAWAWVHRQYMIIAAGVSLGLLFTAYSVTSSMGFSAINRAGSEALRGAPAMQLQAARRDLQDTVTKIDGLAAARAILSIEQDIAGLQGDRRWRSTAGCTNATANLSIAFCAGHKRLLGELDIAKRHATLEARRVAQQERVDSLMASGVVMDTDPQSKLLSKIAGVDREHIKMGLTILLAALVEFGSVLGFFLLSAGNPGHAKASRSEARADEVSATIPETIEGEAVALVENTTASPSPAALPVAATVETPSAQSDALNVDDWFTDRLEFVEGTSETATGLYEDYQKWALLNSVGDMTFTEFGTWLNAQGLSKSKIGGRMRYIGVSLRTNETDNVVRINKSA